MSSGMPMPPSTGKYRKRSSWHTTPRRVEGRRSYAPLGAAGGVDQPRMDPLETSLKAELVQARAGGCSHRYGWAVTESKLVVWEITAPTAAASRPILKWGSIPPIPLNTPQLSLSRDEAVDVLFPWQFDYTHPFACVLVSLTHGTLYLISMATEKPVVRVLESERPLEAITATAAVWGEGVIAASTTGFVEYYAANPTECEWTHSEVVVNPDKPSATLQTVLNLAAMTTRSMGWLFGGQQAAPAPAAQRPTVSHLLYSPVPRYASVFIISRTGRIEQRSLADPLSISGKVVLEDLTEFSELAMATRAEVVAATLSFNPEGGSSLQCVVVNMLVAYHCEETALQRLTFCRVCCPADLSCADSRILRKALPVGWIPGQLRLFAIDGNVETEDDENFMVVATANNRGQIVRFGPAGESVSRFVSGNVVAVSESTAPYPQRLSVVTTEGWVGEAVPSATANALRRQLQSGMAERELAQADSTYENASLADLVGVSKAITNEPVTDAAQCFSLALDDTQDRTALILAKSHEKLQRHNHILYALSRKQEVVNADSPVLRVIADNGEKLALAVALRELQTALYSNADQNTRWYSKELVAVLTAFSKSFPGPIDSKHEGLKLTPLQTFYTEASRLDMLYPFLARWAADGDAEGASVGLRRSNPLYVAMVADVAASGIQRILQQRMVTSEVHAALKWTHTAAFLDALSGLVDVFAAGVAACGSVPNVDPCVQDKLILAMKVVASFYIAQKKEASQTPVDPTSLETSSWVRGRFLNDTTDVSTLTAGEAKSLGYRAARDIGHEVAEFNLLVALAWCLPVAERLGELQGLLTLGPEAFFKALLVHFRNAHDFAGLLKTVQEMKLGEAHAALFAEVAGGMLGADHPARIALVGPALIEKTPQGAQAALVRAAECVVEWYNTAGVPSHASKTTVAQMLHYLKTAKFAVVAGGVADAQESLLDSINTAVMVIQVQREVLASPSPTPLPPQTLFTQLLSGPSAAVPGSSWATAPLDHCVHQVLGHRLAWAFPLIPLVNVDPDVCLQEVWARALTTPSEWWLTEPYNQLLDLPEPEQHKLIAQTHFCAVFKTVLARPRIKYCALKGGVDGLAERLVPHLPAGMSESYFYLLLAVSSST